MGTPAAVRYLMWHSLSVPPMPQAIRGDLLCLKHIYLEVQLRYWTNT